MAEIAAVAAEAPPPVTNAPEGAVPVVNPQGTGETLTEAPAAPISPVDYSARATEVAPVVRIAVAKLADMVAPNWEVTKAEADGVGDAFALVLAYWMPETSIDPKYLALMSLGVAVYGVVDARRDPETGDLKPLRKEAKREPVEAAQGPPPQAPLAL